MLTKLLQVIAVGAEMVVDDVEDDGETVRVRVVNELPEVIRRSVPVIWSEQCDTVVAPAEPAWKLRDGHDLDHADPEFAQLGEMRSCGGVRTVRSESPDVHFVEHSASERRPLPAGIAPQQNFSHRRGLKDHHHGRYQT